MSARLPVLDGASRAASIAAFEARLSRIIARTGGNDILIAPTGGGGAEQHTAAAARS